MSVRRLVSLLLAVVAVASVSACTQPRAATPAPSSTVSLPITEDDAFALIKRLSDTNNTANSKRDSTMLATYEGESQFAIDDAEFTMGRVEDPTNAKPIAPFAYTPQKAYIAPGATYPQFFLLMCTFDDGTIDVAVVLSREKSGDDWKFVVGVVPEKPIPELDTDSDNNAVLVDPDDAEGLIDSPANIAKAQAAYLTNGAGAEEAKLFGTHRRLTSILGSKTGMQDSLLFVNKDTGAKEKAPTVSLAVTVAPYPVRALRTREGGALAFYTTSMQFVAEHPKGMTKITGKDAALAGKTDFDGKVTLVALDQWVVYIPPKGGGKVEFLGNLTGRVSIK